MSKQLVVLKIDVKKIDKKRLFEGAKGVYLDAVLFLDSEPDQYENNGMITQSVSKEEREAGVKGNILGNAKIMGPPTSVPERHTPEQSDDDIDFLL
jgi:hypothetical protein